MFYPVPNHRLKPFQHDFDLPETEIAAASASRCRSTRRCRQGDLERIVTAVNALARAGA
jgi:perosamine synthetase